MKPITESIQHFNLAGIDLNLLVVFDALLTEQHLTRAAKKIGLSQPATSNALARLRKLFKDELFIKVSRGMTPTPRALSLATPIRQALAQIQLVVGNEPDFDPMTSDRIFRIGMDDYTEIVFLPHLLHSLKQLAPQVRVQIKTSTRHIAPGLLDDDKVDVALGYFQNCSAWHHKKTLFTETFIGVANLDFLKRRFKKQFKQKKKLTLDEYVAAPHLLVSPKEDMVGAVDERLAQQNLTRTVAVSVPNFLIVPFVLCNNDLIATLPTQIVSALQQTWTLHTFPLPLEPIHFSIDMLWHQKQEREPGNLWLRARIAELCSAN